MGDSVPLAMTEEDEIADALLPPAGPVSETSAAPLGAKETENAPGSGLGLTTIGPNVPSSWTWKTSMLFVARSVTTRNRPSGLKANDAASELLVVRKRVELGIFRSCPPAFNLNPTTLLLPPTLST